MKTPKPQRFTVGYHMNSWDFAGLPMRPALEFLAETGFSWFEILSKLSVHDQFSRRFVDLGDRPHATVTTDTDLFRRYATLSQAQRDLPIRLSSLYVSLEYINSKAWPVEIEVVETLLRVLKGFDAPIFVLGGGKPDRPGREHTDQDYRDFARSLEEIGRRSNDLGIKTVYHPHLDNFIERRDQLDRFMDVVDMDLVGLCIDPAHLAQTHSDPVDATRTYMSAIRYMHFKDTHVTPGKTRGDRYKDFCELGQGVVDLPALADVLLEAEYDGIAIIELDMGEKPPEQSALESVAYLREVMKLDLKPAASATP